MPLDGGREIRLINSGGRLFGQIYKGKRRITHKSISAHESNVDIAEKLGVTADDIPADFMSALVGQGEFSHAPHACSRARGMSVCPLRASDMVHNLGRVCSLDRLTGAAGGSSAEAEAMEVDPRDEGALRMDIERYDTTSACLMRATPRFARSHLGRCVVRQIVHRNSNCARRRLDLRRPFAP